MAPTGHRRRVVPIPRNSMENSLQKHVKKFECDPAVGSLDKDLLSRYSSHVGGKVPTARCRRAVRSSQNSRENNLRKYIKKFECHPKVGSLDTDLLSRYFSPVSGMILTVHCRRVVPIPRNSMENSLRKQVKKFERDPTVGFLDTNIWSRYSRPVGGMAQTGRRWRVVPIPRNSMENNLQKHVK